MASVRIVDMRTPERREVQDQQVAQVQAQIKRSPAAQAALMRAQLPETVDGDAFMAVYDAASDLAGADALQLGDGHVGEVARMECPGRPDLMIVHGRGAGGCSYVMAMRVRPEPAKVRVAEQDRERERSWADEDIELELPDRQYVQTPTPK
jgi:hypothetical protein